MVIKDRIFKGISKIRNYMICPPQYLADFRLENIQINVSRLRIISLVLAVLSTLASIYLWFFRAHGQHFPVPFFVLMHLHNVVFGLVVYFSIIWMQKKFKRTIRFGPSINLLFLCYSLGWTIIFTLLSQAMNGQITVYVIGMTCVAIISFLDPRNLAIIYAVSNSLFLGFLPQFQSSESLRASHLINSMYMTAITWLIATILYNSRINNHIQKQVINRQFSELVLANKRLEHLSTIDALTGMYNRRVFDETIDKEWRRAARQKTELALAMIDIDHFKAFNDTYGHLAGDACLKTVSETIRSLVKRPGDALFRYGGEEFAIIMADSTLAGANLLCEKIRLAVADLAIPNQLSEYSSVTISIGVSSIIPDSRGLFSSYIHSVDQLLYKAKQLGRNIVVDHLD
jgi:diguanylate cyclase (GGDEF)-like protein